MNVNSITEALVEVARAFTVKMADKVQQNKLPKAITTATYVKSPQSDTQNSWYIDIVIDLNVAPMAAAFEWGSGIWRTRGVPNKYIIEPTEGKEALAFEYGVGKNIPDFIDESVAKPIRYSKRNENVALFKYVLHPGVQPKPYLIPSIIEKRALARKKLGESFKAAIMAGVPPVTIIEVK